MSNNNDFNTGYEKAMLDWYNSTNSNSNKNFNKNSSKSSNKPNYKGFSVGIFGVIVLVLFTIAFSHYIRTGTFIDFSFKSMIDYLSNMPDITLTFSKLDLTIKGNWGVFDFLRSFFNIFTSLNEIAIQISSMMLQAFIVIGYLVGMIFI